MIFLVSITRRLIFSSEASGSAKCIKNILESDDKSIRATLEEKASQLFGYLSLLKYNQLV